MQHHKKSVLTIEVESYVILRKDWSESVQEFAPTNSIARAFRIVNGRMEWQYFETESEAKEWADKIHECQIPPEI